MLVRPHQRLDRRMLALLLLSHVVMTGNVQGHLCDGVICDMDWVRGRCPVIYLDGLCRIHFQ